MPADRSPGTRNEDRLPAALAPCYVLPEERGLVDRLALLGRLARLVRLPHPAGGDGGNWGQLFDHEPLAAMAELLAFDPERARQGFEALVDTGPEAAAAAVAALARDLAGWLARLAEAGLREAPATIEAAGLAAPIRALAGLPEGGPADVPAVFEQRPPAEADAVATARAARRAIGSGFERLLGAASLLRPAVAAALEARLGSGRVDPALGLIVAELRLLAEAEARINRFADRHVDFYYRDILGQAPLPSRPDSVLIRFAPTAATVTVPAGAGLVARVAGSAGERRYRLVEGLRVAPVRVAAACSLRYERNTLISPQSEMGFVTAVTAGPLRPGEEVPQRIFVPEGGAPAAMGLDIASPVLWLEAGRRRIDLALVMTRRQETVARQAASGDRADGTAASHGRTAEVAAILAADADLRGVFGLGPTEEALPQVLGWIATLGDDGAGTARDLVHRVLIEQARRAEQVRAVFGRIVASVLVEGADWPDGAARAALVAQAETHLGEAGGIAVARLMGRSRDEAFRGGLGDAFELDLSTASGPLACRTVQVSPIAGRAGIAFRIILDESHPPLVAPAGERAPLLRVRMAPEARFCPVSLFEPFALEAIEISAEVEGLTRLAAFTDEGPADVSQPFAAFGMRPRDGATLLLGAWEMAMKPVTSVAVSLAWADLPRNGGGFAEYFRPYGPKFQPPEPRLHAAYLTGEGWKPLTEAPVPMATASAPDAPLSTERRIESEVPGRPEPARGAPRPEDFRQRQSIRSGLVRLRLELGPDGFGHDAYPAALARAMRPRLGVQPERPLPPPPLAPQVARVALGYAARAVIALNAAGGARPGERVTRVGPFGTEEVFPHRARPGGGLFPARLADGALFLQLAGPGATGPLSLAFEMAEGSFRRTAFAPRPVAWHYLTAAGWMPLPGASLGSDSTEALMRSGLVALDLPDDAALASPQMPGEGAWIAVTTETGFDAYPRLAAVTTNGARAECVDAADAGAQRLAATWTLDPPVPGVGAIAQLGAPFGGAPAEARDSFRARVGERLQHRDRVVTAWDAERIVLAAFPEVWQVKCFPALGPGGTREAGAMTVVVVPAPPAGAEVQPAEARMFDVLVLRRIEAHLAARASRFARIAVRNPSFERLQMRGRVAFRGGDDGSLMGRLKLDLSRFLSVWTARGPLGSFGWSLNLVDVGAFVAETDYVEFLTDFSLLHLVADDGRRYRLHDTARAGGGPGAAGGPARPIAAVEPWALALPMRDHWISVARDRRAHPGHAAGIGGLGIGETLVVGSGEGP
jgi:hypothetical protein